MAPSPSPDWLTAINIGDGWRQKPQNLFSSLESGFAVDSRIQSGKLWKIIPSRVPVILLLKCLFAACVVGPLISRTHTSSVCCAWVGLTQRRHSKDPDVVPVRSFPSRSFVQGWPLPVTVALYLLPLPRPPPSSREPGDCRELRRRILSRYWHRPNAHATLTWKIPSHTLRPVTALH